MARLPLKSALVTLTFIAAAALGACSSDSSSGGTAGGPGGDDSGTGGDTGHGGGDDASNHDSGGGDDTGPGGDDSSVADTGGDGGGFNPTCSPASVQSACGKPDSIVRVVAKLGNALSDASGTLRVHLNHYRLGSAGTGGVPHTEGSKANVTVGPSKEVEVQFDMCTGGEMWSEDNCEFNLVAWVDKNNDNVIDSGEPAARTLLSLSCKASGPACVGMILDCTSGASCASFTDPGYCSCSPPKTCNSPIQAC
jgi:hypothetical protein